MQAKKRRMAWVLLALCILLLTPSASWADAIPVTVKSTKQNGTVRVRLDSVGTSGSFTLTTSGSYSLGGSALSSGTKLSVSYSGSKFSLTINGSTRDMGTGFTLIRTGSGDSCGIKIAEAYSASNIYPGDLQFLVRNGTPYAVCHVFIEDYLDGVVPYEMSNSFPAEALKAQAVTARTFALRRMASASSNYYDLRDTTSDQVYRGTPSGYSTSKSAVDTTAGRVLMYGSDYCAVYYSSSNGGQTESAEHAWGGTGYSYLKVKDDPYDLAHPNATVRRATVYSNFSSNTSAIQNLLSSRLLSQHSISTGIATIEAVTPESPKYAAPSRLYTQMRFTLRLTSGQSYQVIVPIFGTLDGTLGLSMSSSQNELFSVSSISGGFSVVARRYGHGVGLSQYGAAQMANQGMDYLAILGFYFEGATLVQHSFTNEGGGGTDVTPTATPSAGTSIGQATVILSDPTNKLNMRSRAGTDGSVVGGIPHGTKVDVYSNAGGWAQVRYGGVTGYVASSFLQFGAADVTPTPGAGTAVVSLTSGSLNLRARESVTSDSLIAIPNGTRVTVVTSGSVWTQVRHAGYTGYVMTRYLIGDNASVTPTPSPTATGTGQTARVVLKEADSKLNLRSQPNTTTTVVVKVPHGATVTVLERGSVWSRLRYQNIDGYAMTEYLSFSDGAATASPTPSPTPTGSASAVTATVHLLNTTSTLNMRQSDSTKGDVVARIPHGAQVTVTSRGATWCAVTYQGRYGYVVTSYLRFNDAAATPTPSPTSTGAANQVDAWIITLSGAGNVNLRATMQADASVLVRIPHGQKVSLRGDYGDWCEIVYNGRVGYVSSSFVTKTNPSGGSASPTPTANSSGSGMGGTTINYGYVKLESSRSTLNLRSTPSGDATAVAQVDHGAQVDVLSYTADGQWATVRYNGTIGYAARAYLTLAYKTATVRLSDTDSTLVLRGSPSADGANLTKLDHGLILTVIDRGVEWTRVRVAGGMEGYVATAYLLFH